jgi:hypothetical protein
VGKDYTQADIDAMQPGITTFMQAQERLGKPQSVNYAPDGRTAATWVRVSHVLGSMSSKGVSVLFDKEGKMIRIVNRQETNSN